MGDTSGDAAKPMRADARRNREQVLDVARDVLAADGSSASFDEIARRAGVGVGTVYRHFPTRNALFKAVIADRVEKLARRARMLSADGTAPHQAFHGYFAEVVREVALNQALCEALDNDAAAAIVMPGLLRDDFVRSFETLLSAAKKAGAVRAEVGIHDVLDLVVGAAAAERRARARGVQNQLTAIVLDGLRAR